jgi:hypothetical protein
MDLEGESESLTSNQKAVFKSSRKSYEQRVEVGLNIEEETYEHDHLIYPVPDEHFDT